MIEHREDYPIQKECLFASNTKINGKYRIASRLAKVQAYLEAAHERRLSKIKEIQVSAEKEMNDYHIKMGSVQTGLSNLPASHGKIL